MKWKRRLGWLAIALVASQGFACPRSRHRGRVTLAAARTELVQETRLLRETLGQLAAEVRLLRQELSPEPDTEESPKTVDPPTPAERQPVDPPTVLSSVEWTPASLCLAWCLIFHGSLTVQSGESFEHCTEVASGPARKPPVGTTLVKVVSAGGDAGDLADFFLEEPRKSQILDLKSKTLLLFYSSSLHI